MGKKRLRVCTLILIIGLLCGCTPPHGGGSGGTPTAGEVTATPAKTDDAELTELRKRINQKSRGAGMAFLGYIDEGFTEADIAAYLKENRVTDKYPFLTDAALVMTEGQELYAVVPPNKAGTINVYPSRIKENGEYEDDKNNPIFSGKPGEIVILKCNMSEIYSNVLIAATDGGGAVEIRPMISLKDGRISEENGAYDFTEYGNEPDGDSLERAMRFLRETEEVKTARAKGMKLLYTGDTQEINGRKCLIFALATEHEGHFVKERFYGVCDGYVYVYDALNDTWTAAAA